MYSDPISDMLTRIRNACVARKAELTMPFSNFKRSLADLLMKEGFISGVNELDGRRKMLQINLKYSASGDPVITGIDRVSKPGQRIYLPVDRIPRTNSGLGVTVVSTPKGLMSDRGARKARLGGEVVARIW